MASSSLRTVKLDASFADAAIAVWREVSAWLAGRGIGLWSPDIFDRAFVDRASRDGEIVGCLAGDALAGVALLHWSDDVWWPDRPTDDAAYAHKVAVSRAFAGTGVVEALFAEMESLTLAAKRSLLRLDTPAHRPSLIALYERLGFTSIDERTVGELVARRFEKRSNERT